MQASVVRALMPVTTNIPVTLILLDEPIESGTEKVIPHSSVALQVDNDSLVQAPNLKSVTAGARSLLIESKKKPIPNNPKELSKRKSGKEILHSNGNSKVEDNSLGPQTSRKLVTAAHESLLINPNKKRSHRPSILRSAKSQRKRAESEPVIPVKEKKLIDCSKEILLVIPDLSVEFTSTQLLVTPPSQTKSLLKLQNSSVDKAPVIPELTTKNKPVTPIEGNEPFNHSYEERILEVKPDKEKPISSILSSTSQKCKKSLLKPTNLPADKPHMLPINTTKKEGSLLKSPEERYPASCGKTTSKDGADVITLSNNKSLLHSKNSSKDVAGIVRPGKSLLKSTDVPNKPCPPLLVWNKRAFVRNKATQNGASAGGINSTVIFQQDGYKTEADSRKVPARSSSSSKLFSGAEGIFLEEKITGQNCSLLKTTDKFKVTKKVHAPAVSNSVGELESGRKRKQGSNEAPPEKQSKTPKAKELFRLDSRRMEQEGMEDFSHHAEANQSLNIPRKSSDITVSTRETKQSQTCKEMFIPGPTRTAHSVGRSLLNSRETADTTVGDFTSIQGANDSLSMPSEASNVTVTAREAKGSPRTTPKKQSKTAKEVSVLGPTKTVQQKGANRSVIRPPETSDTTAVGSTNRSLVISRETTDTTVGDFTSTQGANHGLTIPHEAANIIVEEVSTQEAKQSPITPHRKRKRVRVRRKVRPEKPTEEFKAIQIAKRRLARLTKTIQESKEELHSRHSRVSATVNEVADLKILIADLQSRGLITQVACFRLTKAINNSLTAYKNNFNIDPVSGK